MREPIPNLKTLLARGWRKKCPQCGKGPIYVKWLKLHERCSSCGLEYLPNQGDLWGPLLILDRLLFIVPFIVLFYFHVWHPGRMVYYVFGTVMILAFVFTLPNRNAMSLAVDYMIRRKSGDLQDNEPTDAA